MASSLTVSETAPLLSESIWHVLLVGNREEDFFLIREILDRNKIAFTAELDHARSIDEAKLMWRGKSAPAAQRNAISLFRKTEVQAIGHREYKTQDCLNRHEN